MKTFIRNLFLLPALIAGLGLLPAGWVTAQTFTTLHSFAALDNDGKNSDGAGPDCPLILSGNTLYGTALSGGSLGHGAIFKLNTDGTDFTTIYNFTGGSDGSHPKAGLILSGNTLYGTAQDHGSSLKGTVFKVNTDGAGFTTLHEFTATSASFPYSNSDGADPVSELLLSGSTLYGTASLGGSSGVGTVFAVSTDGTDFTTLHNFDLSSGNGANPLARLILSGDTLYGTTSQGGSSARGTVFKLNTDGSDFMILYNFSGGSDGALPIGGLILSGNTLYGTTQDGGLSHEIRGDSGTVFKVNSDGSGFTVVHAFTVYDPDLGGNNNDGRQPEAGLILSGDTLYGTTYFGGSYYQDFYSQGVVFAVKTDGTGFTVLHSFTTPSFVSPFGNSDGRQPVGELILSDNTLYGTAQAAGTGGMGTVFKIWLEAPPRLSASVIEVGTHIILTWPTNAHEFTLQSTTNLFPPVFWNTNYPLPTVVNGQNVFTNLITGPQKFFRLSH